MLNENPLRAHRVMFITFIYMYVNVSVCLSRVCVDMQGFILFRNKYFSKDLPK